jgi:hypothetical protein
MNLPAVSHHRLMKMGTHTAKLAVRFLLEISALVIFGVWGWHQRDDGLRILVALAIPLLGAVLWGVFAVPNDPTRSGSAPVPIPGMLRLALELGFFASATCALYDLSFAKLTAIFGTAVALHYLLSYDRIHWLVSRHETDPAA